MPLHHVGLCRILPHVHQLHHPMLSTSYKSCSANADYMTLPIKAVPYMYVLLCYMLVQCPSCLFGCTISKKWHSTWNLVYYTYLLLYGNGVLDARVGQRVLVRPGRCVDTWRGEGSVYCLKCQMYDKPLYFSFVCVCWPIMLRVGDQASRTPIHPQFTYWPVSYFLLLPCLGYQCRPCLPETQWVMLVQSEVCTVPVQIFIGNASWWNYSMTMMKMHALKRGSVSLDSA